MNKVKWLLKIPIGFEVVDLKVAVWWNPMFDISYRETANISHNTAYHGGWMGLRSVPM